MHNMQNSTEFSPRIITIITLSICALISREMLFSIFHNNIVVFLSLHSLKSFDSHSQKGEVSAHQTCRRDVKVFRTVSLEEVQRLLGNRKSSNYKECDFLG